MAHDVFLRQFHHANPLDAGQNAERLFQSAQLVLGQVYLRHVARDNHLGVPSHTSEEHADLSRSGVLRFIENHDSIRERSSAHKGQRSNLNDVLVHHVLQLHGGNHVFKRIVERLQIGVDLLFHVARKESQLLTGFNGRTRKDDFLGGLLLQSPHGKRNREIGLSRSGRTYRKHHVVLLESVDEPLLVLRAALDGTPRKAIAHHSFHGVGLSLLAVHDVDDVFFRDGVVFQHMAAHVFDLLLESLHFPAVAKNAYHVVSCDDTEFGIQRFNHLQMTVVHTIENNRVDVFKYNMLLYQILYTLIIYNEVFASSTSRFKGLKVECKGLRGTYALHLLGVSWAGLMSLYALSLPLYPLRFNL